MDVKKKILSVEDNHASMMIISRLLTAAGYDVIEAVDGPQGIKMALRHKPDLILMDINLPIIDGCKATTMIKNTKGLESIPVVAITANSMQGDRERSLTAGCDGYISKPINVGTFVADIESYLKGKRERVEEGKEVEYLKRYNQELVQSLENQIEQLNQLNEQLEINVSERTVDLEQATETLKFALDEAENKNRELERKNRYISELNNEMIAARSDLVNKNKELETALQELKRTQKQLVQSEKMASIGQLAAGVAHEINNPIGFIRSNMSTLSEYFDELMDIMKKYDEGRRQFGNKSDKEAAFYKELDEMKDRIDYVFIAGDVAKVISETKEGTERVARIIKDLKEFSHTDQKEEKKFANINQCIESTLNVVWSELKYKATVTKDFGRIPEVNCYPHQLSQVFMNLLVNASHAIEDKGEIGIKTFSEGKKVFIRISDNGKGMSHDTMTRIFEPFYTTKPVGKGTGLGLSVSYNIIEKHSGSIGVESEEGKGTTFTIELPVESGLATV